jgi:sugar O-acyltransferase (sialic acid O-acetyltransferase NeuD family)
VKIVIAGAGGHGKVVCDAILSTGVPPADILGFADDDWTLAGGSVMGFPVLRGLEALELDQSVRIALGIGSNEARRRKFDQILALGYDPLTVVHARAVIAAGATLGRGVALFANVVVNSDTHIEDDVVLNTACSVDHDCRIGPHVHIGPGARLAGGVTVGEGTLIGVGAAVVPGVSIGARAIVGAGAVVLESIESDCVAVGVPARVVKRRGEYVRG